MTHNIILVALVVAMSLLAYQSFVTIPASLTAMDEKIELLGCPASPIHTIEQAIKENIATGDEDGTASSLICMFNGELFFNNSFPDVAVTFELLSDDFPQAEELLKVTSESVEAVKSVVFTAYAECQSGVPNSCMIYIVPLRALDA